MEMTRAKSKFQWAFGHFSCGGRESFRLPHPPLVEWFAMVACAAAAFSLVACGDSGSSSAGSSGDTNETTDSSVFECCLNGSFYDCPDQDALNQCGDLDPSGCTADSSRDTECE